MGLQVARSAADVRVGQVLLVGKKGRPVSARMVMALRWGLPAMCVAVTAMSSGWPWAAYYAAVLGLARWTGRHYPRALVAMAEGRDEDALQILARSRRGLVRPSRVCLDGAEGRALWRLGRLPEALARFERVLATRKRSILWWMAALSRLQVLLASGNLARALELRATADGAPDGPIVRAVRDELALLFAFAGAGSGCDGVPDEEQLHDWAREYLGWEIAGHVNQVLLAWAFQRHGDLEMAGLCLGRAEETEPSPGFLSRAYPALDAWRRAHGDALLAARPSFEE
jgi:hypothetical protein